MSKFDLVPMRILKAGPIGGIAYRKGEVAGFSMETATDMVEQGVGEPAVKSDRVRSSTPRSNPKAKATPANKVVKPGEGKTEYETK